MLVDRQQQPPRLRRQLIKRTAQHLMRQPVRNSDVFQRDFDVLDGAASVLDRLAWPLVLMQQGDAADERQILHVVAARACLHIEERQLSRVGICNEDGL